MDITKIKERNFSDLSEQEKADIKKSEEITRCLMEFLKEKSKERKDLPAGVVVGATFNLAIAILDMVVSNYPNPALGVGMVESVKSFMNGVLDNISQDLSMKVAANNKNKPKS